MIRQMRIALLAAGSAFLLGALVLGFLPVRHSYQLGGMSRPVTLDCGSPLSPSSTMSCVGATSGQMTWTILLAVIGLAALAAGGYLALRRTDQAA